MIQNERIQSLNTRTPVSGRFVLYWMQRAQRTDYNHALEFAIAQANQRHLPLITFFGLTGSFPRANRRHYHFMLQGLQSVEQELADRGIRLVIRIGSPETDVVELASQAALVIVDRGYVRPLKQWREFAARHLECPLIQVETDVVVPIDTVSDKEEYSAATIRPKIHRHLERFLVPLAARAPRTSSLNMDFETINLNEIDRLQDNLKLDSSVRPVPDFHGGTAAARCELERFIRDGLDRYVDERNDPGSNIVSNMSPYLHFGQISPLYIALRVRESGSSSCDAYLEELIVRRELSINFIAHNPDYDNLEGLPAWARETLHTHADDPRDPVYSIQQLESAGTHDPYWNAAQMEMMLTGKMHGYMRMYWGKKILEWSPSPTEAMDRMIQLNDRYELDGRDPNGYTGIAWCLGKHDRPWAERPVFGKTRYMNANGLKRKFDIDSYVEKIKRLAADRNDSP